MKIAIEGCVHGELEKIYETIEGLEKEENIKVDVLLCCGDFQTLRNMGDIKCMAVPPKYSYIGSFYKYYSGEKLAPVLTILIGGNHEASNYFQELPYGGWVAPRIYYLGYAGVINIAGIRIAGLSGIFKDKDYLKGHFEIFPYDESTKRSIYHVRNLEVFRLRQLTGLIDIFLSHDWPTNVVDFGNKEQLLRFKPHFRDDIEAKRLGSKPCEELLTALKPTYWFSAHLHCKFAAYISHGDNCCTKFLALDKCLPSRRFLQIIDIPHNENEKIEIKYDLEWLTTLVLTNHLLSTKAVTNYMPGPYGNERYNFTPSIEEKTSIMAQLKNDLTVPESFMKTAESFNARCSNKLYSEALGPIQNAQTVYLCNLLNLDDPVELILKRNGGKFATKTAETSSSDLISFTGGSGQEGVRSAFDRNVPETFISLVLPEPKTKSVDPVDCETSLVERSNNVFSSFVAEEIEDGERNNEGHYSVKNDKGKRRNILLYRDNEENSS